MRAPAILAALALAPAASAQLLTSPSAVCPGAEFGLTAILNEGECLCLFASTEANASVTLPGVLGTGQLSGNVQYLGIYAGPPGVALDFTAPKNLFGANDSTGTIYFQGVVLREQGADAFTNVETEVLFEASTKGEDLEGNPLPGLATVSACENWGPLLALDDWTDRVRVRVTTDPVGYEDQVSLFFRNPDSHEHGTGTLAKLGTDLWEYRSFDEPAADACFTGDGVVIDADCEPDTLQAGLKVDVKSVFDFLKFIDENETAYDWVTEVRYPFLSNFTFQGEAAGFTSVVLEPEGTVSCGGSSTAFACTSCLDTGKFGSQAMVTEWVFASVVLHELVHTTQACSPSQLWSTQDECEAYTEEAIHQHLTHINVCDPNYLADVISKIEENCGD